MILNEIEYKIDNSTFSRKLDDDKLNILIAQSPNSLWAQICKSPDLKIFIRENELHAYYNGCRICGINFKNGKLIYDSHYKYLNVENNKSNPYIKFNDNFCLISNGLKVQNSSLEAIKKATDKYSGAENENLKGQEKIGIHKIIDELPNVIDVEIAFGGVQKIEIAKISNTQKRIDFAAFIDGEIHFFEVKQYFYTSALRVSGDIDAPVIAQLDLYDKLLEKHVGKLQNDYENIWHNFISLEGEAFKNWENFLDFKINTKAKLVIIDIPKDLEPQSKKAWAGHLQKLKDKKPVICIEKGQDFATAYKIFKTESQSN
jgi:hypothetical protein